MFEFLRDFTGNPAYIAVPNHRATTAHLRSIYPFMATPDLGSRGIYIGNEMLGSSFCFDPWELYTQGLLTNPNMLVIGQVGRGKSSLVKTLVLRGQVFGRKAAIIDPKGEYFDLARALGVPVLSIAPGGRVRLNPLDPGPSMGEIDPAEIFRRQNSLLQSIISASMERELDAEERTACELALNECLHLKQGVPTLPDIVELMLYPSEASAKKINTTPESLAANSREAALELRRMCEGDLKGMFDGETNVDIDWNGPAIILDLSAVFASSALGLLMTCAMSFMQSVISRPDTTKRFLIIDEAWAVLKDVRVARWLQQSYKMSRAYGVSNVAVMHRISDLKATGAEGSEAYNLALGMLSDTETRVIYNQPSSEVELATSMLKLSRAEAEMLPMLGVGQAIWRVGGTPHLVQHQLGNIEWDIVNTDQAMVTSTSKNERLAGRGYEQDHAERATDDVLESVIGYQPPTPDEPKVAPHQTEVVPDPQSAEPSHKFDFSDPQNDTQQ
jgi:hypothetical protein